jgi:hypothetical protein
MIEKSYFYDVMKRDHIWTLDMFLLQPFQTRTCGYSHRPLNNFASIHKNLINISLPFLMPGEKVPASLLRRVGLPDKRRSICVLSDLMIIEIH